MMASVLAWFHLCRAPSVGLLMDGVVHWVSRRQRLVGV